MSTLESSFRLYTGKELMELKLEKRAFIIDKLLKEKDSMILVGEEKAGKSLCAFQMACSLTSGQPFLDNYVISRECKVAYVQMEGELEDTQDRLKRMSTTLNFNPDNFLLYYTGALNLQDPKEVIPFVNLFKDFAPDALFLDPAYFSLAGDLNDNAVVRAFTANLRAIKNKLNCALAVVHHTHRVRYSKDGHPIAEGDEVIFGSKFFKAWADHTLLLVYDKKNAIRILTCSTQRSGEVEALIKMRLIQPEPLYFQEVDTNPTRPIVILDAIRSYGGKANLGQLLEATHLHERTIYRALTDLICENLIYKETTAKPINYCVNEKVVVGAKEEAPLTADT